MTDKSNFYKLIHVGKSSIRHGRGYSLACHFQPWSLTQNCPKNESILYHEVNSAFAGSLICSTIWTNTKDQAKEVDVLSSDNCIFKTGPHLLYARKLEHIIEEQALVPADFWSANRDTWVISVKSENKTILIPYFELLRSLFYQTSRRLTDFIFSKTPLKFLCRQLVYPSIDNSFTARYCVATTHLTAPEARLVGNLLFDPDFLYIFNTSQAYWLSDGYTKTEPYLKEEGFNAGNLNNFHFSANGNYLVHNNEQYFWVNKLDVLHYNYRFSKILFHPIAEGNNIINDNEYKLPEISNILSTTKNYTLTSKIRNCTVNTSPNNAARGVFPFKNQKNERHAIRKTGLLPLAVCMSPWATKPRKLSDYKYFNDNAFLQITEPIVNRTTSPIHTNPYQRILDDFEEYGYSPNLLTINNSEQTFGENISVFPVDKCVPLQGNIHKHRVQCFSLAEIVLDNSIIYIAQPFPQINPDLTILFIKQNLTELDNAEWNEILEDITPVRNAGNLKSFYKKINSRAGRTVAHNTAVLAIPLPTNKFEVDFCLDLVEHIIDRFRKRLQFFLATYLKFPQGITQEQGKIIKKFSHNTCRVPDALWKTRISNCWP